MLIEGNQDANVLPRIRWHRKLETGTFLILRGDFIVSRRVADENPEFFLVFGSLMNLIGPKGKPPLQIAKKGQ
jgi:hypothetical protein